MPCLTGRSTGRWSSQHGPIDYIDSGLPSQAFQTVGDGLGETSLPLGATPWLGNPTSKTLSAVRSIQARSQVQAESFVGGSGGGRRSTPGTDDYHSHLPPQPGAENKCLANRENEGILLVRKAGDMLYHFNKQAAWARRIK